MDLFLLVWSVLLPTDSLPEVGEEGWGGWLALPAFLPSAILLFTQNKEGPGLSNIVSVTKKNSFFYEYFSKLALKLASMDISNSLYLARKCTNNSLASIWRENHSARIFVRGHYLFWETNDFRRAKLEENCKLQKTDNVQGQISEHFLNSNGEIVFIILWISVAIHGIWKLGKITRIFASFSWSVLSHMMRSDQSRASENI